MIRINAACHNPLESAEEFRTRVSAFGELQVELMVKLGICDARRNLQNPVPPHWLPPLAKLMNNILRQVGLGRYVFVTYAPNDRCQDMSQFTITAYSLPQGVSVGRT